MIFVKIFKFLCILSIILFANESYGINISDENRNESNGKTMHIEQAAEKRAANIHRINTLLLMIFVSLLVIIVLITWLFKHKRFLFIHETGLMLVFGLLIGMVLKYKNIGVIKSQTINVIEENNQTVNEPPDYLLLAVKPSLSSLIVHFHYELLEGFFADKKDQSEHQLEQKAVFSPEIFFNLLLPPIIFNAGYSLKKRHFFRNIGSVLIFAFLGTTISTVVIAIIMYVFSAVFAPSFSFKDLLFFGALLSATDPVTVLAIFQELRVEADLFALVFGESALNDAVSIVLSNSVESFSSDVDFDLNSCVEAIMNFIYVFFGSLLLGSSIGCLNALVTKLTRIYEYPLLESALFVLLSYLSFLIAEFVQLTGIVAVLFCAICQAHYTYNNLSNDSKTRTKQLFEIIGFLSESFTFSYIGVSLFAVNYGKWNLPFLFMSLISIIVARAAFIYPLSALLNVQRRPKIPMNYQHMLLFSGLRGALAFALSCRNTATENRQIMATTTSAIVFVTVLINGGLVAWLIQKLGIKYGDQVIDDMPDSRQSRKNSEVDNHGSLSRISGSNPWDKALLPRQWYNFDAMFMKPFLTHSIPSLMETMPSCFLPLARLLTSDRQMALYASAALDDRSPELSGRNNQSTMPNVI